MLKTALEISAQNSGNEEHPRSSGSRSSTTSKSQSSVYSGNQSPYQLQERPSQQLVVQGESSNDDYLFENYLIFEQL